MTRLSLGAGRAAAASLLALGLAPPARCFLGFADTSFVTVIANPAEAANWAAELERLSSQVAAAQGMLETVSSMRAAAGDPRAAVGALGDLAGITSAVGLLSSGAQTEADLARDWQALGSGQRLLDTAALLEGAGPGATMQVFGQDQPRDPSLYSVLARDAAASLAVRAQIASEQAARSSVAAELAGAWAQFREAPTESSKQAILTEISQLESQDQLMDARRRAVLDDLALSDRQERTDAGVRVKAADERRMAESALLNSSAMGRAQAAESQRAATLGKPPGKASQPDYGGIRLWTTADAGGASD
ncbi:MAG TPA: hypothetical protein VN877_00940 [Opitutaceae bacterium]|nr:hypothetical protein [Opitutaceae bacterium]